MDRVVIKQDPTLEQTEGGIYIPESKQDDERPQRGIVIAAGPGRKDEPITVEPGDHVMFGAYAGTNVRIKGEDYLIMRESDILLKLPD
jgi:chaperonin GroES